MARGTKETKNLGTLLVKDPESIVDIFRECCTGRQKTLIDPKSISYMSILDAVDFSVEQLSQIQDYVKQAAKFLNRKKNLGGYAKVYEQIDTCTHHLIAMQRAKDLSK